MFQFHIVRLKAISPNEYKQYDKFQFHIVRLKGRIPQFQSDPCSEFQFHIVRLKENKWI